MEHRGLESGRRRPFPDPSVFSVAKFNFAHAAPLVLGPKKSRARRRGSSLGGNAQEGQRRQGRLTHPIYAALHHYASREP